MKTKLIQKLLWLLALSLGLMSCKKNETPKSIDPYVPVTEGKVFLPVLTNKPDMEKVKKTEAGRNGKFESVFSVSGKGMVHYEFSYTGMDVKKAYYIIRKVDGVLMGVRFENVENEDASKIKALAKKNGFSDSHILAKRNSWIVRDGAEGLFRLIYDEDKKSFSFRHYGKPVSDAPSLSAFFDVNFIKARFAQNYDEIKSFETGRGSNLELEKKVESGKYKDKVNIAMFKISNADGLPSDYFIKYWFDWKEGTPADKLGKCKEFGCFFSNPSYFYDSDDIWKEIIFRPEFLNLCEKSGYEWDIKKNVDYPYDCFKNDAAGIVLVTRRQGFDDLYSGNECSVMNFYPISGSKASESDAPGLDSDDSPASMRDR